MNYYYELNLNFNDDLYYFYEWDENDKLERIKKIPIIKIKSKLFKTIVNNNFEIDDNTFKYIENKTLNKDVFKINNACIFCDTKNCIAIEFDNNKKSIARSFLMLEDENNICDISYTLKYHDVYLENIKKLNTNNELRQELKIKKIITKEIFELYKNNNLKKLKYLYYEWFNLIENNKDVIVKNMYAEQKKDLKTIHHEIYNIIKMSYNKENSY